MREKEQGLATNGRKMFFCDGEKDLLNFVFLQSHIFFNHADFYQ
jgi:hypothetical protein